jgi:hypothetical protein
VKLMKENINELIFPSAPSITQEFTTIQTITTPMEQLPCLPKIAIPTYIGVQYAYHIFMVMVGHNPLSSDSF